MWTLFLPHKQHMLLATAERHQSKFSISSSSFRWCEARIAVIPDILFWKRAFPVRFADNFFALFELTRCRLSVRNRECSSSTKATIPLTLRDIKSAEAPPLTFFSSTERKRQVTTKWYLRRWYRMQWWRRFLRVLENFRSAIRYFGIVMHTNHYLQAALKIMTS